MIIDISVAVIAVAVLILAIFSIVVLVSINKMLRRINHQMESFDSFLRSISNVGDVLEEKTIKWKERVDQAALCSELSHENTRELPCKYADVITLAAIAVNLWQKVKKRS